MKKYTWKEAFEDSYRTAMMGSPRGQNFIGYCYDVGRGVRRNPKMAKYWFEKAARNGNVAAIYNVALINDIGQGIRRNAPKAARLYQQAAQQGHLQAQANLAVMLLEGDGIKQNNVAGLRWLRRAAQRGDDKSQYNLGYAYAYGEDGVRKNDTNAQKWLSKAAKRGHAGARRLLKSVRKKTTRSSSAKRRAK